ncbi:hypothetical protein DFP72DRAFT_860096 [Ephemerocybe angulata]|uniref:Uncharacterized protein n=1 Tax=Ephemerocybe angulata TaxID=980116 RepID=A0A8H6HA53_9AGAR|nr:hypothetical protein DFP72DRAFT_860096 [Tulosesus angulatus]
MTSKKDNQQPPRTVKQLEKLFNLDPARVKLLRRAVEKLCVEHLDLKYTATRGGNKEKLPVAVEKKNIPKKKISDTSLSGKKPGLKLDVAENLMEVISSRINSLEGALEKLESLVEGFKETVDGVSKLFENLSNGLEEYSLELNATVQNYHTRRKHSSDTLTTFDRCTSLWNTPEINKDVFQKPQILLTFEEISLKVYSYTASLSVHHLDLLDAAWAHLNPDMLQSLIMTEGENFNEIHEYWLQLPMNSAADYDEEELINITLVFAFTKLNTLSQSHLHYIDHTNHDITGTGSINDIIDTDTINIIIDLNLRSQIDVIMMTALPIVPQFRHLQNPAQLGSVQLLAVPILSGAAFDVLSAMLPAKAIGDVLGELLPLAKNIEPLAQSPSTSVQLLLTDKRKQVASSFPEHTLLKGAIPKGSDYYLS